MPRAGSSIALMAAMHVTNHAMTEDEAAILVQNRARDLLERKRQLAKETAADLLRGSGTAFDSFESAALSRVRRVELKRKAVEHRLPEPLSCLCCCCCRTFSGLGELLTKETTREFALAVILGESFYTLVETVANSCLNPVVDAILKLINEPEQVVFKTSHDFVVLVDGVGGELGCDENNQTIVYQSASRAIECGATVVDFGTLRTGLVTFVLIVRYRHALAATP